MLKQAKTHTAARSAVIISAIIIAAVTLAGCKDKPAEPPDTEHPHRNDQNDHNHTPLKPTAKDTNEQPQKPTEHKVTPRISLNDVIRAARFWRPSYTDWYGKTAPEFTLTDFDGKEHKLSHYRGKDVMLVFFATWCGPCIYEIQHLIAMRNAVSEDKLAILAIAYQNPDVVKKVVTERKINYTVLFENNNMPAPFGVLRVYRTQGIPCSFFINPDGKIKLATSGVLRLNDIKAILQAQ
jgi:peroxiredoxin